MRIGDPVRLRRAVERYPHFIAAVGLVGTIKAYHSYYMVVTLDAPLVGAEEWDNAIVWNEEEAPEFGDDVELLSTGRFANLDF